MNVIDGRDLPNRCRECDHPLETPVGCLHCHAVFPARSDLTHFDRLGLPRRFDIASGELERHFLAWSRELHPDYFQTRPESDQQLSLSLSASLNDAYATLRDPFRRAEYLLALMGGPTASQQRSMPADFLERVLELRMEIEEAGEDAALAERLRGQLLSEKAAAMREVGEHFARLGEPKEATPLEARVAIREKLNTVKYLDGLLRELPAAV